METVNEISIEEPPKTSTYLIIIAAILLLILVGVGVWAFILSKPKQATETLCPCDAPKKRCNAFWNVKIPIDGGMTFDQAMAYAQAHGVRLATKNEVMEAGRKGFENCLAGWYNNPTSYNPTVPGIGYYVPPDGCGKGYTPGDWYGLNSGTNYDRLGSAFFIGTLPQGADAAEINKYIFL
jgi:hypothetical protein